MDITTPAIVEAEASVTHVSTGFSLVVLRDGLKVIADLRSISARQLMRTPCNLPEKNTFGRRRSTYDARLSVDACSRDQEHESGLDQYGEC